jgi:hypothetical protein
VHKTKILRKNGDIREKKPFLVDFGRVGEGDIVSMCFYGENNSQVLLGGRDGGLIRFCVAGGGVLGGCGRVTRGALINIF